MKFSLSSAVMGACIAFGLLGLNSFRSPRVDCLTQEQEEVLALLSVTTIPDCVEGPGYNTLVLTGANLQIVNGTGYTDTTNGLGNLIVGYGGTGGTICDNSGSHNVIVGQNNAYASYAGLATGLNNQMLAPFNVVHGGANIASDQFSEVLGGLNGLSDHDFSVLVGGSYNIAEGDYSVGVGGEFNSVSNNYGVTVGGYSNTNTADHGVMDGGSTRSISGQYDWRAGSLFEDN
jgi:hypothetical protein